MIILSNVKKNTLILFGSELLYPFTPKDVLYPHANAQGNVDNKGWLLNEQWYKVTTDHQ